MAAPSLCGISPVRELPVSAPSESSSPLLTKGQLVIENSLQQRVHL
jgi:hypothetical protein